MWTIIFTLVPIVHLIFGYFPVNFTVHVVVTMMAHYLVRIVMLLYCDSLKQMRALWFSRVAVSICWWYDFKASLLIPLKAAIGPGTSFRSRSWSDLAPARNIKALRWPFVLLILSIIAFIGGCVHLREVINLPTVLSLCLIVINIAPPLLIISYWNFGQGMLLTRLSTLLMVLSGIAAAAAFTFLWLLYPRDVDFARAARLSLRFLNAERSGVISGGYPIDWRSSSGLQYAEVNMTFTNVTKGVVTDKTDFFFKQVDLSGGFYNDGEIGAVKLTWNIAVTTSMLAWSMLEYPGFWGQSLELQNDISSILMHGALYMQEIYVVTPLQDPLNPGRLMSSSNDQIIYVVRTPAPLHCMLRCAAQVHARGHPWGLAMLWWVCDSSAPFDARLLNSSRRPARWSPSGRTVRWCMHGRVTRLRRAGGQPAGGAAGVAATGGRDPLRWHGLRHRLHAPRRVALRPRRPGRRRDHRRRHRTADV